MLKNINVTYSSMPDYEEYIKEIRVLWQNHIITNMGIKHSQLESRLKKFLGVDNITLFTNGHLALEYAITNFTLHGEVITTPFTFASTTHAIVRSGLDVVFCDINPSDFTIDVDKIEKHISEKTSAIIPVHVYGNVCNVKEIDRIAQKYKLKIIYDAAHAFGVSINKIGIGNFGDASMFSFHATKVFNTIEGGAIILKDKKFQKKLNYLKNFGITGKESVDYIGGNAKMNEFQAAMGLCNLRHIDDEIKKRELVFQRYMMNLDGINGIKLVSFQKGVNKNYSYFPVLFDAYKKTRDEIVDELKENKIFARKYFYPLTNNLKCYTKKFNNIDTPVAKYIADRVLTLPLYADLAIKDVDRICKIIKT